MSAMQVEAHLERLLSKAILKHLEFRMGTTPDQSPPTGKRWMILSGTVGHTTATYTRVMVQEKEAQAGAYRTKWHILELADSDGTQLITLFSTKAGERISQWCPFIIDETMRIHYEGDTVVTSYARVSLLEW